MNQAQYDKSIVKLFDEKVKLLRKLWKHAGCPMPFEAWAKMRQAEEQQRDNDRLEAALERNRLGGG